MESLFLVNTGISLGIKRLVSSVSSYMTSQLNNGRCSWSFRGWLLVVSLKVVVTGT